MIRQATENDINSIMEIYKIAQKFMINNGNQSQWGTSYPSKDLIELDIQNKNLYVLIQNETIHAVFAFIIGTEPTYEHIEQGSWKSDKLYGTIHKIASDGSIKGVFIECLNYCKTLCKHLRIDTHFDNHIMQHLIEKYGFEKCGIIHVKDGTPRIAFEYLDK